MPSGQGQPLGKGKTHQQPDRRQHQHTDHDPSGERQAKRSLEQRRQQDRIDQRQASQGCQSQHTRDPLCQVAAAHPRRHQQCAHHGGKGVGWLPQVDDESLEQRNLHHQESQAQHGEVQQVAQCWRFSVIWDLGFPI